RGLFGERDEPHVARGLAAVEAAGLESAPRILVAGVRLRCEERRENEGRDERERLTGEVHRKTPAGGGLGTTSRATVATTGAWRRSRRSAPTPRHSRRR